MIVSISLKLSRRSRNSVGLWFVDAINFFCATRMPVNFTDSYTFYLSDPPMVGRTGWP
jgi:hypothetical protein